MKKRSKIFLWITVAFILTLISILGIAAFIAAALLDEAQFPLSQRTPDPQALETAIKKLDTFSKTKKGKKRDWTKIVFNFLLNPVQSVTLDKNEVNALIDAGLVEAHAKALAEHPDVVLADASFNGKLFILKISKNITKEIHRDTPFGHFINISMECEIEVVENHLQLRIHSLKIGSLHIPERWYDDALNQQIKILEKSDDGKKALNIIRSLKVDDDKVILKYNAKELMIFLMNKLPELNKLMR